MNPNNAEAENCRVITKFNGIYEGTLQLDNASIHVNGSYNDTVRKFSCMEVVLDEDVKSADDTRKLGISAGDIVCFDPRSRVTEKGYIKTSSAWGSSWASPNTYTTRASPRNARSTPM